MATRGSLSRSTEAVRQLFQVEEVTEDMLLKLQEDQNFEWDEDEGFLVLIPTTGGATYEGYERATEQQIRQALKATEEEQEANDLGYRYWLAQTLHYGFRPRFSLKRMQNKFRKILKTEKSLEPPIHLLRLSLRLSDAARNERSSKPAFCIQDVPETLDQLKQEDQDADGEKPDNDAVADEDGEEGHGDENEDSNAEGGDSDKDEDRDSNISADQATELQDVPLSSIESTGRDVSDISETESRDSSEDELDSSLSEDERTYSVYQDGEEDADSDDSESGIQAIRRSIRLSHKSAKKKQLNREQSPSGASGDRRGKRTAAEATVPRSPTTRLSQWRRPRVQVRVPARFDDRDSYPPAASFPSAQTIFDPPRSTSYPSHAIRESDGIVSAQQPSNMGAGVSTESRVGAADPEEREVVLASRSKRSPQISKPGDNSNLISRSATSKMPRRNKAASQRMPERPRSRLEPVTPVKRSQNLPKVRGEMSDAVPEATHITKEQQLATGDRRKRSTRSQLEAAMAKAESGKYIRDAYGNELFVRDEVDFDHMDRGVVYAYKSNMFRVRSHDEDFSGSQPLDLLHNAMTALRREEMLLRGLQQRVPSRCGYEVQANRDQALRDFIGIEPAGDLEGIGLPLQPARRNCAPGLVSYEGESDISWQVEGKEDGVASALPNEVDQPPFINCMVRADSGNDNAEHIEAPAHGQRMISLSPCFMKTPLGGRRMIDRKRKQEHAELDENDGDDATTATFRSGNKKLRSTEETGNRCSVATTGVGLNSRRHASSTEFRVDLDHPSSSTPQSTEHATPADRGKPGPPIEASNDPGRRHDKRPHTEQVTSAYKGSHASGKKSHNMLEPRDECSDVRQTRSNGWLNIHKPQCQGGVQGDSNQSNGSSDSCVGLPEEEPLLCKWRACRRSQDDFKTLKELYQHIGTAHYGRACEWDGCNKVFATLSRQYEHVLIHVPYRAHQCHVCGKTFKMYGNLNVHYRNEHSIDVHANQTSLDYSAPPETKSASTKDVVDAMEVVDPYLRPDNGPFEMTRRLSTFDQYVNTAPQPSVARQIVIPEVNHLTHRLAEGSVLLHGEGTASASSSEQGTPERDSPEDEPADDSVTRSDRDCDDKHNSGSDPPHNMCKGEADSPGYFSSTGRSAGAHSAGQNQSLRDESLDADSKLQAALSNAEMLPNGKIACCVETSETAALESAQAAFRYQGRTRIRREIVKWQQIVDDIAAGTLESWAESRVRKAQTDLSQFELASNTKSKCDDRRLVLQQELKMAKFALEREHHYYRDVYGAMEAVPIINCLQLSPADVAKPSRQPRWEDEYGFRPIAVVFEFLSLATLVKMVRVRQDAIEIWTETSKRSPEDTACYQKKIDYTEKQVSWIRREMSRRENH